MHLPSRIDTSLSTQKRYQIFTIEVIVHTSTGIQSFRVLRVCGVTKGSIGNDSTILVSNYTRTHNPLYDLLH